LATSIASWANLVALTIILQRRGQWRLDRQLRSCAPRIVLAALAMGAGLWVLNAYTWGGRYLKMAMLVAAGGAVYFAVAELLGAARLREMMRSLQRQSVS
jgi:putative peptidoglycan lipid II flippase